MAHRQRGVRARQLARTRELFGEIGEVAAAAGPEDALSWRRHLAEALGDLLDCRLALVTDIAGFGTDGPPALEHPVDVGWASDADRAAFALYLDDDHAADPMLEAHSAVDGPVTAHERRMLLPDRGWYRHRHVMEYRRQAGVDSCIYASARIAPGRSLAPGLHRAWGDRRFSEGDVELAFLVQHVLRGWYRVLLDREAHWIPEGLAPRHRRILGHLLAGAAEKEIAQATGLRWHTVREYVKQIYRRLDVSSRAELITRCRRAPPFRSHPEHP